MTPLPRSLSLPRKTPADQRTASLLESSYLNADTQADQPSYLVDEAGARSHRECLRSSSVLCELVYKAFLGQSVECAPDSVSGAHKIRFPAKPEARDESVPAPVSCSALSGRPLVKYAVHVLVCSAVSLDAGSIAAEAVLDTSDDDIPARRQRKPVLLVSANVHPCHTAMVAPHCHPPRLILAIRSRSRISPKDYPTDQLALLRVSVRRRAANRVRRDIRLRGLYRGQPRLHCR